MNSKHIILIGIVAVLMCSCVNDNAESKLISFEYGGFGDTIFASLSGNVYDQSENKPLGDVKVSFEGTTDTILANIFYWCDNYYPKDTSLKTDSNGFFHMGFFAGNITILLEKEGYGTLKLINYRAVPDQYSYMKAILNQGNETTTIDIEKQSTKQN